MPVSTPISRYGLTSRVSRSTELWIVVCLFVGAFLVAAADTTEQHRRPNIVFLVCESTDGRTWQKGYQDDVIPLPNLRYLQNAAGGYSFDRHYANSPVCCPSRATLWSGRHAHRLPHVQEQSGPNGTTYQRVNGTWNNFEGLPRAFDQRMDQVLERAAGYTTRISGKRDWATGGHSRNVQMSAWTMYTRFPYDIPKHGGWRLELPNICADNGTVTAGNASAHGEDWKVIQETVDWIHQYAQNETNRNKPFFVYQGMFIVHPPYRTNEYYYNKIDPNKIRIPKWPPLDQLHPCDFQSSMLKGCIPPLDDVNATAFYYSRQRRRNIRRIYYAMIAEFDAMVGAYLQAIRDVGQEDNTIFIITSDHGDQQMEHQQTYKMVPYDASASVPLVIYDGRRRRRQQRGADADSTTNPEPNDDEPKRRIIDSPTQLIDLYPTIMDLVGVKHGDYPRHLLDGHSLVPLMTPRGVDHRHAQNQLTGDGVNVTLRPDFVVSQFHGMNIAMSWFLIVRPIPCVESTTRREGVVQGHRTCTMKLVVWGTGKEVDSQLFDLTHDPDEMVNLIHDSSYASTISTLDDLLRSVVDYPRVAVEVANYNRQSMKDWIQVTGEPRWRDLMHSNLRWDESWDHDSAGAFQAFEEWLNGTTEVLPCRGELVWPPPAKQSVLEDTPLTTQQ